MTRNTTPSAIMSESNERLARVETRLNHHGELLERMDEHMRRLSESQAEMSRTLAVNGAVLQQFLELAQKTAEQDNRLTALEGSQLRTNRRLSELEQLPPKVSRNSLIASAGIWLAGTVLVIVLGAAVKGWLPR